MDKRETEQLRALLDEMHIREMDDKWRRNADYDVAFLNHLRKEVQGHWEFMSWLKQTYPEALEAWVALKKLKGE